MSALRDLTAAHGERRKAVQAALKDLSTAVLETQTTLALDEALMRRRTLIGSCSALHAVLALRGRR